jgi:hypothetical protein
MPMGFALCGLGDEVRVLVPVGFAEAEPVQLSAVGAMSIEVGKRALGVAVLPRVDTACSNLAEQLVHMIGRVPIHHRLAEDAIEMRITVDRVAANDEPRNVVRARA